MANGQVSSQICVYGNRVEYKMGVYLFGPPMHSDVASVIQYAKDDCQLGVR